MNGIEKQITRKVCEGLIADGYLITVDYEYGFESEPENRNLTDVNKIIKACDEVDQVWLMVDREPLEEGPYDGFVMLIWGNGDQGKTCVSDYCTSLCSIIDPIVDWVDRADVVLVEC